MPPAVTGHDIAALIGLAPDTARNIFLAFASLAQISNPWERGSNLLAQDARRQGDGIPPFCFASH